jgi:hypothetical protein
VIAAACPRLGLPERLAILTAVEYRHLGGVTEPPDLVAFMIVGVT